MANPHIPGGYKDRVLEETLEDFGYQITGSEEDGDTRRISTTKDGKAQNFFYDTTLPIGQIVKAFATEFDLQKLLGES